MIHFDKTEKIKRQLKGPDALFITILSVFIFIYLVFFVSTILSFLSFLKDPITASSVSEYARTGFFQLSIVSLINVGIFSLVKIIGNEKSKPILVLLSCIGVETLGLIFLGFAKMQLYISKFGLTIMRYNTSAFMLILFLCVCLFIAALWKPFNYIRVTVLVIALSILGISYQNAGGFIASRNYEKYQQKTLYDFDLSVFYDIGADAVPAALRAYQETDDKELKAELEEYLHYMEFELTEEAPNKINYSKEKAKILLKKYDNKEEK